MVSEHITAGEFQRFSYRVFIQLDRIEDKQDLTNGRVLSLETDRTLAKRIAALISAGVGALVAFIAWAVSYFKG